MEEPDGRGPGCMTYPLGGCDTQAKIDVRNITLRDINSTGGILPPGVIRCNETNVCTDINLENVNIDGWWSEMGWSFITEYALGKATNVTPSLSLDKSNHRVFELFSIGHFFDLASESLNFYNMNENDITGWEVLLGFVIWGLQMMIAGLPF
jgi:hypothetical protein